MKVVLLTDVKKVGKKGEVVEVSDGYGRNVLIKKKQGVEATNKAINEIELKNKANAKKRKEELEDAKALGEKLKDMSIKIPMKVGEGGRVFGSVSSKEIATEMEKQVKLKVDKKKIVLKDPIKSIGTHLVPIKLHTEVTAELKVQVVEQ